ncbi:MAG: D-tyrosyl-tRNA(Tyr) deacylase [Lentisphaerae bacterium]|nr:D-tyrosyl-tRNA(Tyr) deacylase [Lentisphaerota bacterium]
MKVLIQRVTRGSVCIDGVEVGAVAKGVVVFLGVRAGDAEADALHLAQKTASLRIFADAEHRMNLALQEVGGGALVISQFTLYADTRKGNRPSFIRAGPPDLAEALYNRYVDALRAILTPERVATGRFGAMMAVEIHNDGPVTIELTTDD